MLKHLAQIVVVLLQRLLAEDDVPAAGEGGHHEIDRARRGQLEFDGVLVRRVDLLDRGEQRGARDADAGRRLADAVVGRLHVGGGEVRPVVELHALAQVERVGLAVLGDFPAMRQIGDDALAAVARIAPDQVVEHASLGADVADGARLMHVEMRRPIEDAVAHHAAPLRIGFRRRHLELRPVVLVRNIGGKAVAWRQTVGPPIIAAALPRSMSRRDQPVRRGCLVSMVLLSSLWTSFGFFGGSSIGTAQGVSCQPGFPKLTANSATTKAE